MLSGNNATKLMFSELTLSEIVKDNFHTAALFEKYNLDFCCKGNRLLIDACAEKRINPEVVMTELEEIFSLTPSNDIKPDEWELNFLIEYIVNNHHKYVSRMLPVILTHTQKVASVHGENHPETIKIAKIFSAVNQEMKHHMMKEEKILFPHINHLVLTKRNGSKAERPYYGTIKNPIAMMENEHQSAGDGMFEIRKLANNFTTPDDACQTYRVVFKELKEFEEDLHKHVHLENNILFPKAIELEEQMF
jgi:regulator of cell morphogenesis and NO signaling